jgi:two-component system sensor histidine kinase MtrB
VAEGLLETRVEASLPDEVGVLAASFNQMAAALQDMIQRERRFVAAVSHELRTPLAALHTTSELLAAQADRLPPDLRESADLLTEDVRNLRRLVEELLEVSDLESRRARLAWEDVDLRAVATALVRRRRADVPVQGPSVRTWTDKARVERILANLIDNALHHGQGRDVTVSLGVRNSSCEVAVADHGPGISSEDLPHLFERFYKADRSRTRSSGGIGLGLAIAMQNARLLGGTIEPRNRSGGGAIFLLQLPMRESAPEENR